MDKRELTYAKQTILGVKDWDSFQQALRYYVKLIRPPGALAGRAVKVA